MSVGDALRVLQFKEGYQKAYQVAGVRQHGTKVENLCAVMNEQGWKVLNINVAQNLGVILDI